MAQMNARPTDPPRPPSAASPRRSGADEFLERGTGLARGDAFGGHPMPPVGPAGPALRWVAAFATLMERLNALADALDLPDAQRARQCLQQAAMLAAAAPEFVRALPLHVDPRSGEWVGEWIGEGARMGPDGWPGGHPGARPISPAPAAVPTLRLDPGRPRQRGLTARERDVLSRVADGLSNKQIARELQLSPHTIKRHMARICATLGCRSRAAAAAWWARTGRDGAGPSGSVVVAG